MSEFYQGSGPDDINSELTKKLYDTAGQLPENLQHSLARGLRLAAIRINGKYSFASAWGDTEWREYESKDNGGFWLSVARAEAEKVTLLLAVVRDLGLADTQPLIDEYRQVAELLTLRIEAVVDRNDPSWKHRLYDIDNHKLGWEPYPDEGLDLEHELETVLN